MDTPQSNGFRTLLSESARFVVTCEHIPGRVSNHKKLDDIIKTAESYHASGLVHAVSLTDNPGGTPAISPDVIAREIERIGLPAIVHFSAKDMNRNVIESRALALDRAGIRNLLVMSGDFPTAGQSGLPKPVFDLDPVHILCLLSLMNRGKRINFADRTLEEGQTTDFFHGAVVSTFKFTEPGLMLQLAKMEKKAKAGARVLVAQFGFDARKHRELIEYARERNIRVPLLGSVFVLRMGGASVMHRGEVPGAYVDDRLLAAIAEESKAEDKGKAGSLERAAMQVAVLRGLGYRGAHIEGLILTFPMVETILGRADELAPDWEECAEKLDYSPAGSFSLRASAGTVTSPVARKLPSGGAVYHSMRLIHDIMFVKEGFSGRVMRGVCRALDRIRPLGWLSHRVERAMKRVLFDCRDCGDCALPELRYLCPQSQCPKGQRNGPCGGSHLDVCEVYPDRPCIWSRIYTRAKSSGELESLRDMVLGPCDWKLRDTSGWVNYHLGRDHAAYDFRSFFPLDAPPAEAELDTERS
jgi:methylenetetrahydrofolate reductase (NADPH)